MAVSRTPERWASFALVVVCLVCGCGDESPVPASRTIDGGASGPCVRPTSQSRWAVALHDTDTRPFSSEAWQSPVAVRRGPNSTDISVLDMGAGEVITLDEAGHVRLRQRLPPHRYAAPMRLVASFMTRSGGRHSRFMDVNDTAYFVFDAESIWAISTRDSIARRLTPPTRGIHPGRLRAVALVGGVPMYLADSTDVGHGTRMLSVRALDLDASPDVVVLSLSSLPTHGRTTYQGPDEAMPMFATRGECLYAMDGHSARIVVLGHSSVDTVYVPGLDVGGRTVDNSARQDIPAPSAVRNYDGLAVDPDGWVWIALSDTRRSPVEVLLWDWGDDDGYHVTVPHFPSLFLRDGSFIAVTKRSGADALQKVRGDQERPSP